MEMFRKLIQQLKQRSLSPPPTCAEGEVASKCNLCELPGHFMQECELAAEYMQLGKCKCSVKGKIVLSAGGVISWHIMSMWLHDCIDEYHWINPGEIAAAQMLMEMMALITQTASAFLKAS